VRHGSEIADVLITYPGDFTAQMLEYAEAARPQREEMLRLIASEQRA
jgi:hypothetical protein